MSEQEEAKQEVQSDQEPKQPEKETDSQGTVSRAELGSIVSKQIAKAKAEWDKQHAEDIAKAKQDGKDEATMTAKELAEKHTKEREARLDQREKEYEKKMAELDHRDHLSHTKELLAEQDLPTGIAKMVLGETEEETRENIKQYKEMVDQGVRNAIHRNSAQSEPQNGGPAAKVPDKKFSEMSLDEQTELYRKDPELYAKLSQQH